MQSWTPPHIYLIRNSGGWGLGNLVFFTSPLGDIDISLSLRTTAWKRWSWWGLGRNGFGEGEIIRGPGLDLGSLWSLRYPDGKGAFVYKSLKSGRGVWVGNRNWNTGCFWEQNIILNWVVSVGIYYLVVSPWLWIKEAESQVMSTTIPKRGSLPSTYMC